jgi:hypothetical protein
MSAAQSKKHGITAADFFVGIYRHMPLINYWRSVGSGMVVEREGFFDALSKISCGCTPGPSKSSALSPKPDHSRILSAGG